MEALRGEWCVVAMDLRGYGGSDKPQVVWEGALASGTQDSAEQGPGPTHSTDLRAGLTTNTVACRFGPGRLSPPLQDVASYRMQELAADVAGVIEAIASPGGSGKVVLCGHDWWVRSPQWRLPPSPPCSVWRPICQGRHPPIAQLVQASIHIPLLSFT